MDSHSFPVNIKNSSIAEAVDSHRYGVAVPISNRDIVEEENVSKSPSVIRGTVNQPDCPPGASQVETKVSYLVVDALAHNVAVIVRVLADDSEYREVGHEWRAGAGWEGDDGVSIESHGRLLQEDDLAGNHSIRAVEEVLLWIGYGASTEVATGTITVTGANWSSTHYKNRFT